jgi:hypothetical protein
MSDNEKPEVPAIYEAPTITVLGELTELTQMAKRGYVHDFLFAGEHKPFHHGS